MAESLLAPEFLQRLEYLYIVTREQFIGHVSAERLSKKFGVGLEFADYRAYAAGDDYRYIDWAALARRGDMLIKLFTEEQATHIYLAVDLSRSMATGRPEKLHYAKKIAAALGYIGLSNLDPVTILPFDTELRADVRSYQGRGQLRQMLLHLEDLSVGGGTSLGTSLHQFVRRFASRRGIVILISDFLDHAGYEEATRLLHYHRFSPMVVQVNSPEEIDPPFVGDIELVDSESGETVALPVTPELVASYRRRFEEHYAELARLCKIMQRTHLKAVTDVPFEQLIFDVFRRGGLLK